MIHWFLHHYCFQTCGLFPFLWTFWTLLCIMKSIDMPKDNSFQTHLDNGCSCQQKSQATAQCHQMCLWFFLIHASTGRPSSKASIWPTRKFTNSCEYLNCVSSSIVMRWPIVELTTWCDVDALIPRSIAHRPSTNALLLFFLSSDAAFIACSSCFIRSFMTALVNLVLCSQTFFLSGFADIACGVECVRCITNLHIGVTIEHIAGDLAVSGNVLTTHWTFC